MSELIRAWLDKNCVQKNTAIYVLPNVYIPPSTGAETFGDRNATPLQLKSDCYFLCVGWALEESWFTPTATVNEIESKPTSFQIANLTTGRIYTFGGPTPRTNVNFNINNFVTMPQYVLFEPNNLVQAQEFVVITTAAAPTMVRDINVNLLGIEYRMPAGQG